MHCYVLEAENIQTSKNVLIKLKKTQTNNYSIHAFQMQDWLQRTQQYAPCYLFTISHSTHTHRKIVNYYNPHGTVKGVHRLRPSELRHI